MKDLTAQTIWQMKEKELLELLDKDLSVSKPKKIRFYAPSFMYYKTDHHHHSSSMEFPTISVTGNACALDCKHCGRTVLETMFPALTPERMFGLCSELKSKGALGCLISGGCLPDGSLPLNQYVETIDRVKKELGLTIFVHTGIIDSKTADRLKSAGVDCALIDIIGSDETIKKVYNLDITVKDYEDSIEVLDMSGLPFVPHVVVGLHYGELMGELRALEMISKYKPSALVVIAFMPIHGTEMASVEPPKSVDIARVVATARLMFPQIPLVLGCMRPKGKHRTETDVLAMKAGVDAIAFPDENAIEFAKAHGYEIAFSPFCCARIYSDTRA